MLVPVPGAGIEQGTSKTEILASVELHAHTRVVLHTPSQTGTRDAERARQVSTRVHTDAWTCECTATPGSPAGGACAEQTNTHMHTQRIHVMPTCAQTHRQLGCRSPEN